MSKEPKVVVDNHDGRGASLEYRPPSSRMWLAVSYHRSLSEARTALANLPNWKDRNPDNYRVKVHEKDMK